MSFVTDLMGYLRNDSGLAGLVGDRIRFDWMKQGAAYPYITLTRIDDVGQHHSGGAAKIRSPRYQIDVWARNNEDRAKVNEALANALDGLNGTVGSTDIRSVRVLDHGRDTVEVPKDARGKAIYRTSKDVIFWYAPEAVPSF